MIQQHRLARLRQQAETSIRDGNLSAARNAYLKLCRLVPGDPEAWMGLGRVNAMLGNAREVDNALRQALALAPDLPEAHFNLGHLALARGQWPLAENHLRTCLSLQPHNLRAHLELGVALESQGKLQEPEQVYRRALALDDSRAELHTALSRVLREQGRLEDAVGPMQRALQLHANLAIIHLEAGHLSRAQANFEAALNHYRRFAQLAPQERKTFLCNCGGVLAEQERYEDALTWFDTACREWPEAADIHFSRAHLLLGLGRFEAGWDEYEWRLSYSRWQENDSFGYHALRPLWRGEPLQGRKILVYAEQGFGDTIQFSRYLPGLAALGATVYFHCHSELCELFAGFPGLTRVQAHSLNVAAEGGFDYYLPLMSLARVFETRADTIPAGTPYLHADEQRVARWRERLQPDGFRVGLVWAGNAGNVRDRRRSMRLSDLTPLAELENIVWYSLQTGAAADQLRTTESPFEVIDLGSEINDFSDTAAIIKNLDLVITVDTATAHLAGALGCPTWVFIYNGPDWRWQLGREDSPWYPTLRLFRRAPGEAWSGVVARLVGTLRETGFTDAAGKGEPVLNG